ncbi:MAG: hypothetical protein IJZ72_02800 [Oscillospiraceae bacterium]|nr:hypothetical protein [Oscillospiraceae bacterium]
MTKVNKLWLVNFFLPILIIFIACIIGNLEFEETYRYIGGEITLITTRDSATMIILASGCVFPLLFLIEIVLLVKNKAMSFGKVLLSLILLIFSVLCVSFSAICIGGLINEYYPDYYEFSNNGKQIVVCEESYLLSGWGTIYQIDSSGIAVQVGSFGTDDGYRNGGDYEIEWFSNYALIHYYDGNNMRCLKISLK